jgi:hypothetical protein
VGACKRKAPGINVSTLLNVAGSPYNFGLAFFNFVKHSAAARGPRVAKKMRKR